MAADVWSVTSYNLLRREAMACERWNLLHPGESPKVPYVTRQLADEPWPVIATSDYMKAVPHQISPWLPDGLFALGTDGFGRSESRKVLRDYFEIDAKFVALAALQQLAHRGQFDRNKLTGAIKTLGINVEKPDPVAAPVGDTLQEEW